ncbi:MAG: hypothetical protein D6746_02620 [Bacteroidetes bacterium]|nr:MAG: hypothetical protein D6746_02620 [Bacteroidota bacterium]
MNTKLLALFLVALTALGGMNLYQNIQERFFPVAVSQGPVHEHAVDQDEHEIRFVDTRRADDEVLIDQRFKVRPGDRLEIDVPHTDVVIETGASDEAHVLLTFRARDRERAREVYEAMQYRAEQHDGTVRVEAESPRGGWSWKRMGGLDLTLRVRIPSPFELDVSTSHGDLRLPDLQGPVEARTSHGDLIAGTLTGPLVHLATSHGDLEAKGLRGDQVVLNTSHGDLMAEAVQAGTFTARTSHGDIDLGEVMAGTFDVHTSHADVSIGRAEGEAEITNSHGDIGVYLVKATAARLQTSHGDILLRIPERLGAELDLEGGRVHLDVEQFTGERKDDRAYGQLNGGGPLLRARTTHGSISVEATRR